MFNTGSNFGGPSWPRAWLTGISANLAAELGLPVGVVRIVLVVLAVLPTGLAYLALAVLADRRASTTARPSAYGASAGGSPLGREAASVRQIFMALERRLGTIEAFVSSKDFELHKGFRQMRD